MAKGRRHITVLKLASAILGLTVLATAVYIMANGLGLQEELDFGAGAYYYADIPKFDKYLKWDAYEPTLPYWVYAVLFLVWGVLMYMLWNWVDSRKKKK